MSAEGWTVLLAATVLYGQWTVLYVAVIYKGPVLKEGVLQEGVIREVLVDQEAPAISEDLLRHQQHQEEPQQHLEDPQQHQHLKEHLGHGEEYYV